MNYGRRENKDSEVPEDYSELLVELLNFREGTPSLCEKSSINTKASVIAEDARWLTKITEQVSEGNRVYDEDSIERARNGFLLHSRGFDSLRLGM
jgi:hypothetical protein